MKEKILKMFDYFRVSEICIKDARHDREFWAAILGDLPFNVIHNESIKGFIIIGKGEYPFKGEDLSIQDHLNFFEVLLQHKEKSNGCLMASYGGGNFYMDYEKFRQATGE